MKLDTGIQYKELEKKSKLGSGKSEIPFMRTYFDQWTKTFDMSQFDADDGLLNFNRNREDMMNSLQLLKSIDTFRNNVRNNNEKIATRMALLFANKAKDTSQIITKDAALPSIDTAISQTIKKSENNPQISAVQNETIIENTSTAIASPSKDSLRKLKDKMVSRFVKRKTIAPKKENSSMPQKVPAAILASKKLIMQKKDMNLDNIKYFAETIDSIDFRDVIVKAQTDMSRDRDEIITLKNVNYDYTRSYEKYLLRLNQQYSWSLVCVIFLFIGAPLGSIIRKGGYGYPLLVAILFYMIFIITTILGEKLVRNETMGGIQAAWLPCLVLLPFAAFLTIMAIRDMKFNPSVIVDYFYGLKNKSKTEPI